MIYFTKTAKGYSHINENTVCQDFSSSYYDDNRIIITACDGHGGSIYIRSDRGSRFACDAIMNVLKRIAPNSLSNLTKDTFIDKIKLQILCEWNELVEKDLAKFPFTDDEFSKLRDSQILSLKINPEVAYGTTLNACMVMDKFYVFVKLGDGGVFYIKDNNAICVFDDIDENVANITHSICQERAYAYMHVAVMPKKDIEGALICTDGLLTPYQSYLNFQESFVKPVVKKFQKGDKSKEIKQFIAKVASKIGSGDDVSLGMMLCEPKPIKKKKPKKKKK